MYRYTWGSSSGLPHSSHSVTVNGSEGSRIELSASTNGTCATMPENASGARLATAPISRPPAEPPRATSRPGEVQPVLARCRAHATKSVNVFLLVSSLPLSYQARPISPPPRMCATANTTPRSTTDNRAMENHGSIDASYEPYPYSTHGAQPSRGVPLRHTREIGTRVPSSASAHSRCCSYRSGSYPPSTGLRLRRVSAPVARS